MIAPPMRLDQTMPRVKSSISEFVPPMVPALVGELPVGPEWTFEIKHDGYRCFASKSGQRVRLTSRNQKDLTDRFPKVVEAVAALGAETLLIDGEIAVLDD